MISNIIKLLRKIISGTAIFVAICAIIACLITAFWWAIPIGPENIMQVARWIIGVVVTIGLIVTNKLKIN